MIIADIKVPKSQNYYILILAIILIIGGLAGTLFQNNFPDINVSILLMPCVVGFVTLYGIAILWPLKFIGLVSFQNGQLIISKYKKEEKSQLKDIIKIELQIVGYYGQLRPRRSATRAIAAFEHGYSNKLIIINENNHMVSTKFYLHTKTNMNTVKNFFRDQCSIYTIEFIVTGIR